MTLQVTGKIEQIYDTIQVSDKFKKREFVLSLSEEINGNTYTNYGKFQLVQAKTEIIDRYRVGDTVTIKFNIKGNSYVDKKDGKTKYITNLDAWFIEGAGGSQQQQQQQYSTAPTNSAPPPYTGYNYPAAGNPEQFDDLPF